MGACSPRVLSRAVRDRTIGTSAFRGDDDAPAEPLPFEYVSAPVADLLRTGVDRARERVETMLVHRAIAISEGSTSTQPRFVIRTAFGTVEIQCHASNGRATVSVEMARAQILGRELVLRGTVLPATVCTGLAGERVSRVAAIPFLPDDVLIERARTLGRSTRILLALPKVDVFLDEIASPHLAGTLWERRGERVRPGDGNSTNPTAEGIP